MTTYTVVRITSPELQRYLKALDAAGTPYHWVNTQPNKLELDVNGDFPGITILLNDNNTFAVTAQLTVPT